MSVIYQIVCTFRGKSIGGVEKFHNFQNSKISISKFPKSQIPKKFKNPKNLQKNVSLDCKMFSILKIPKHGWNPTTGAQPQNRFQLSKLLQTLFNFTQPF